MVAARVWEAENLKGIPLKIEPHVEGVRLRAVHRDIAPDPPDQSLFAMADRCSPFEKMGRVLESRLEIGIWASRSA
jgi:hypothetical protein